jgi:predicted N-acetyltransferase YhbS
MVTIRPELMSDAVQREALLDRAFGKRRLRKTSQRLRDGRLPAESLAFSATDGDERLIGTIRLWDVAAGAARPALLLGPVAVDGHHQNRGIGSRLIAHAIAEARRLGHGAIVLVGDLPYYERFGFSREAVVDLHLPGPVDRDRFLGLELSPGALDGAQGLVTASGKMIEAMEERIRATA